jgi:hypothetical protein
MHDVQTMSISTAQREMLAIVQRWLDGSVSIDSFEVGRMRTVIPTARLGSQRKVAAHG